MLEKCIFVFQKSLKSHWISFLKKCGNIAFHVSNKKHRVCTSTLYPLVDKCVCKLSLVMPQYYYIWFCSVTIEQSHKSHTACVPYPTTFNIQNKNAHILFSMAYCVIWDMCIVGFMKIVCSSLVQDQLHVITLQTYTWPVMAMDGCPTNLDRIRQFWFF